MIGLNHAVTGALIAVAVKEPLVALPAALLSHFVIDAIPHWDYKIPGRPSLRRLVIASDMVLSAIFVITLSVIAADMAWLVLACGFLAILPDAMWLPYILHGKPSPTDKNTLLHRLRRFHFKIQWSETGAGIYVELLWLIIVFELFFYTSA